MSKILYLLPVILLGISGVVNGDPAGFININCGTPEDFNQSDLDGFTYTSDTSYIDTGKSHTISPEFSSSNHYKFVETLRSIPIGGRNCYTLKPITQGNSYLVRAYFNYGNYDGLSSSPTFELYVGTTHWTKVSFQNASMFYFTEIMVVAITNHLSVCLVDTNTGTPIISALNLRPIGTSVYPEVTLSQFLVQYSRINFGADQWLKYPEDPYDRMWGYYNPSSWKILVTNLDVVVDNVYKTPSKVMQTAAIPINGSSLDFEYAVDNIREIFQIYFYMHFSELQALTTIQSRIFTIAVNDVDYYQNFKPKYLSTSTIHNMSTSRSFSPKIKCSLNMSGDSTLPPLINALEIYIVKQVGYVTNSQDIDAMMDIKSFYKLKRNWMGDPCLPKKFIWDGLACSTESSIPAWVNSLNLSSSGLTGGVTSSLAKLSKLKRLDLSTNKLTGGIPDFLGSLHELEFLNLTRSGLSGPVPKSLLDRSKAGLLNLVYSDGETPDHKKNTNKQVVIIASTISFAVILSLLVIGLIVICKRRRKKGDPSPSAGIEAQTKAAPLLVQHMDVEHCKFKYSELIRITSNFQKKIGEGGFGEVYHGVLDDGTHPVAVKVLSDKSLQGLKEFQAEAQLLSRIHHKSLVRFVGYCVDTKLALVYEYMEKGSLADHLSGEASASDALWLRQRLSIASDAAQGLYYLHEGCKKPIIHRDIKTSNILLGKNYEAKIADFGLSRTCNNESFTQITTAFMGTLGYLDPAYLGFAKPSEKSDIYAFGVVLLELITGRPAIIKNVDHNVHIVDWVRPRFERGQVDDIVDPRIQVHNMNSVWRVVETALECVAGDPTKRPTMGKIVVVLDECMKLECGGMEEPNVSKSTDMEKSIEILSFDPSYINTITS